MKQKINKGQKIKYMLNNNYANISYEISINSDEWETNEQLYDFVEYLLTYDNIFFNKCWKETRARDDQASQWIENINYMKNIIKNGAKND